MRAVWNSDQDIELTKNAFNRHRITHNSAYGGKVQRGAISSRLLPKLS